jgi:hypothetical protein
MRLGCIGILIDYFILPMDTDKSIRIVYGLPKHSLSPSKYNYLINNRQLAKGGWKINGSGTGWDRLHIFINLFALRSA